MARAIGRRAALKTAAAMGVAMAAAPAVVAAENTRVLRFIPSVDLNFLDPHISATNVTRNHGGLVFDQLYGTDAAFRAHPQMVAGHTTEDDGKLWRLTLRDGQTWHDGEKVLARDCVASIRRWAGRDVLGREIVDLSDEISAPDDKTIQFRLKRPFPLLPEALGKPNAYMPAMMPERLAMTDPFKPIPEIVGSGPFRYLAAERLQGVRNVYQRNDKYIPVAHGTPDRGAGPKIVHFERVEWTTIPDQGTAYAALQKGEHDWWEYAGHDLLPNIRKDRRLRSEVLETEGELLLVRFNHTQPPFDNPVMRRILLRAIDQSDFVHAVAGDDPALQRIGIGVFPPGLPAASTAGLAELLPRLTPAEALKAMRAAGYNGEKIIQIAPADYPNVKAASEVLGDLLQRIGVNLDYLSSDWASMTARVSKKDTPQAGGFHLHMLAVPGLSLSTPLLNSRLRGTGAAESGWHRNERFEQIRRHWIDAVDPVRRRTLEEDLQRESLDSVSYAPAGLTMQPSAWRGDLTGVLSGVAKFWNVRRA